MGQIRYDGHVVVVTGAGAGLGKAYALELGRRGAKVVVNDMGTSVRGEGSDKSVAQGVVDQILSAGGQAVANFENVAGWEGGASIVTQALEKWGRLDALIANAGIVDDAPFEDQTHARIDRMLDINLHGTVSVVHAAFRAMKANGKGGRIVMTTSPAGLFGNAGGTPYSTAKGGVVGFTRALALEGRKCGVAVNAISPGAMTRMAASYADEPTGSPGLFIAEDVVPIVLFLAHPECPASGEIYHAMGGWFARIAISLGAGIFMPRTDISPEAVRDRWAEIRNVGEAREITGGMEELGVMVGERLGR